MNDVEFEQKLKSELQQRADRVTPSADAWARIQEQAATDHRRSGWMMGLGLIGAAGAAVAIGVNVLDAPSSVVVGPDPAGSEAVVPTADPSEVTPDGAPQIATAEDAPTYDWSEVALATANEFVSAEGIAAVGDTVMVVGEDPDTRLPATWLSTDGGRTFDRISPEGPSNGAWKDVAAYQGRFLLAGERDGVPAIDVYDPASGQWAPGYVGEGSGVLYAVTDGPAGPIATGNVRSAEGRSGLVLTLGQGSTWTPITDAPGFVSSETVLHHARAAASGYVATGYGPGDGIVDMWFSTDGRVWEHLNAEPDDGSGQGTTTRGVRSDAGVIDALAGDPDGRLWGVQAGGAVHASDDGERWGQLAGLTLTPDETMFRGAGAVATADGLVLVGAADDRATAWWVSDLGGTSVEIGATVGSSLTVGAGATVLDDGTVMVPLRGPEGLFVWRGAPR